MQNHRRAGMRNILHKMWSKWRMYYEHTMGPKLSEVVVWIFNLKPRRPAFNQNTDCLMQINMWWIFLSKTCGHVAPKDWCNAKLWFNGARIMVCKNCQGVGVQVAWCIFFWNLTHFFDIQFKNTALPRTYATPSYAIFAATLFWIGSPKPRVKLI